MVDQNVTKQHLPTGDSFEWEGNGRTGTCRLKDQAQISVYDKSKKERVFYTGAQFNELMRQRYGTDQVRYDHGEPDFEPFEHLFSEERVNAFLKKHYGEGRSVKGAAAGHVYLDRMPTEREGGTYKAAETAIADQLGISISQLRAYMTENNLTWHECGDLHTVRAIPSEINQVYKHTGGIGVQQDFEAMREGMNLRWDEIKLTNTGDGGTIDAEEYNKAIEQTHKKYREIKKQLFKRKE